MSGALDILLGDAGLRPAAPQAVLASGCGGWVPGHSKNATGELGSIRFGGVSLYSSRFALSYRVEGKVKRLWNGSFGGRRVGRLRGFVSAPRRLDARLPGASRLEQTFSVRESAGPVRYSSSLRDPDYAHQRGSDSSVLRIVRSHPCQSPGMRSAVSSSARGRVWSAPTRPSRRYRRYGKGRELYLGWGREALAAGAGAG